MGIALQPLLNLQSQPIHAAPHVGVPHSGNRVVAP
jgi:hypothetical protein